MAKRHSMAGQLCPFCKAVTTAVFEEPTKRAAGSFKYAEHERPPGTLWGAGKKCGRSGQTLGIAAWPDWVMTLNEKAIGKLRGR